MPFTLSHAAAALPFRRFKPVWPALVIGTFAPDLQYFILISDEDRSGHRFPQVLWFTIPFAFLLLWLFEHVAKKPAIALLPSGVQRRLQDKLAPLQFGGWRPLGAILFWIAVGTFTHLAWDQFTHGYSWLGTHWAPLHRWVTIPFLHTLSVAHLLQHISTIGGLLILGLWFALWYRRTTPAVCAQDGGFSPRLKVAIVSTMCAIALLSAYPLMAWKLADHQAPLKRNVVIVTTFVAGTMVFCAQFFVYGLALTLSTLRQRINGADLDGPRA